MTSITRLFERYYNKTASPSERKELMEYIAANGHTEEFSLLEKNAWEQLDFEGGIYNITEPDSMFRRILEGNLSTADLKTAANDLSAPAYRVHFLKTAWFRYAAILLLIASVTTFLYNAYQKPQKEIAQNQSLQLIDIQPGGNKAILTLADGSAIILDTAAIGSVANQGNTKIIKLDAGALAYQGGTVTGEVRYNTIRTPKGGQYQIKLPDGSKVWLNAASSIRFPTVFGKDRTVEITGEIYFEVVKNDIKPFIVHTSEETVRVLGTSFNINAYGDESAVKTTLLEGAVQIDNHLLKAGEAYRDGAIVATDIEQDIAWKNGEFQFGDKANIQTIMRQVSRWYNVDVEYQGTINTQFWGSVSRNVTLSQVLKVLEKTGGVHFKVDGSKIIVLP